MLSRFDNSRWRNQYIDLIRGKPDQILAEIDPAAPERHRAVLRNRAASFEGIVIELGSGSGEHLIEQARRRPNLLFVGFELRFKRAYRTAEKAEATGLKNFLVVCDDARHAPLLFEDETLAGIYINFPDPWEKRRWRKHRLLSSDFLQKLIALLTDGGFFFYKTDHKCYFHETLASLRTHSNLELIEVTEDLYSSSLIEENVPSEFEKLFKSQGLSLCAVLGRKIGQKVLGELK